MPAEPLITLAAGDLIVDVAPQLGGRVARFDHKVGGARQPIFTPITDLGQDPVGPILGGCYPLVPFSNRIAGGRLAVAAESHRLAINEPARGHALHGHGAWRPWQVTARTDRRVDLTYTHDAGAAGWIWPYRAEMSLSLTARALTWRLAVTNLHPSRAMPAGLGLHPYFADRDDGLLAGVVQTHWPAGADRIPAGPEPVPADLPLDGSRPLPRGVDVGFGGWAGQAALASAAGGWRVMMTGDALFSHLVVYTPPGRGFFCVEPVSHAVDGFNLAARGVAGTGRRDLAPGESLAGAVTFTVELAAG